MTSPERAEGMDLMAGSRDGSIVLPPIGFGTMRQKGDVAADLVLAALEMGYRHIDSARKYDNEEGVGEGIRRSGVAREDMIVATKIVQDDLRREDVQRCAEDSLRRLNLDYVDLMYIHWPSRDIPLEETLEALLDLVGRGLVREIGVANFTTTLLARACELAPILTNQVEYHPYLAQSKVLDACRANGVILTAYCPLARGRGLSDDPEVLRIAEAHGRTGAQVVLRWLVQQDGVVAIPGTSSVEHLRENLAIDGFLLDHAEMAAIAALDRGDRVIDPPHAPDWDA